MNLRRTLVAIAILTLVSAACNVGTPAPSAGAGGLDGALVERSAITIEIVTHGQAIDGFWGVVRNGVQAGGADMGVAVNYSAPAAESDMVAMSQLIDAAVAKRPTGLVVSIPNPDALGPAIESRCRRHPRRVDELRIGRLPRPGSARPRRPDRVRGRLRRRRAFR